MDTKRVYGFGMKITILRKSGIVPGVSTQNALAKKLGISGQALSQLKLREKPSKWLESHADDRHKWADIPIRHIETLCRLFPIPNAQEFAAPRSAEEFERMLHAPVWTRLVQLTAPEPRSRFSVSVKSESDVEGVELPMFSKAARFGVDDEPETPVALIHRGMLFDFTVGGPGREGWSTLILHRDPLGQLDAVLPNARWSHTLDGAGRLRCPSDPARWLKILNRDPLGVHTLVVVVHREPWLDKEVQTQWFLEQFKVDPKLETGTVSEQQKTAVERLVGWLGTQPGPESDAPAYEVLTGHFMVDY